MFFIIEVAKCDSEHTSPLFVIFFSFSISRMSLPAPAPRDEVLSWGVLPILLQILAANDQPRLQVRLWLLLAILLIIFIYNLKSLKDIVQIAWNKDHCCNVDSLFLDAVFCFVFCFVLFLLAGRSRLGALRNLRWFCWAHSPSGGGRYIFFFFFFAVLFWLVRLPCPVHLSVTHCLTTWLYSLMLAFGGCIHGALVGFVF